MFLQPSIQHTPPVSQLLLHYPLNAELNPICHLLALVGAHHIVHVSRLRVKPLFKNLHFFLEEEFQLLVCLPPFVTQTQQ
jgi:hypothetical protein